MKMKMIKRIIMEGISSLLKYGVRIKRDKEQEFIAECFQTVGPNWDYDKECQLPLALIWDVAPQDRALVSFNLAQFRTAFSYGRINWAKQWAYIWRLTTPMEFYYKGNNDGVLKLAKIKKNPVNILPSLILPTENLLPQPAPNTYFPKGCCVTVFLGFPKGYTNDIMMLVGAVSKDTFILNGTGHLPKDLEGILENQGQPIPEDLETTLENQDQPTLRVFLWHNYVTIPPDHLHVLKNADEIYCVKEGLICSPISTKDTKPFSFQMFEITDYAKSDYFEASFLKHKADDYLVKQLNTIKYGSSEDEYLDNAKSLIKIMKALRISCYNAIPSSFLSLNPYYIYNYDGRRNILVVGDDYGDSTSNNTTLLAIAAQENINCGIFYLPSPLEQTHGLSNFDLCKAYKIQVVQDYALTASLLESVDTVYVHESIIGLEAIWHGCEVKVFGKPFYAGWGLTCDSQNIERQRQLTIPELFCEIYLRSHIYITNPVISLDNSIANNILTVIFEMYLQRVLATENKFLASPQLIADTVHSLKTTDFWPVLLRNTVMKIIKVKNNNKVTASGLFPLASIFAKSASSMYHMALAYCLVGHFRNTPAIYNLLATLKPLINRDVYIKLLNDLSEVMDDKDIFPYKVWGNKNKTEYRRQIDTLYERCIHKEPEPEQESDIKEKTIKPLPGTTKKEFFIDPGLALKLARSELELRNYDQAELILRRLLLQQYSQAPVLYLLIDLARLKFDFEALPVLHHLCYYLNDNIAVSKAQPRRATDFLFTGNYQSALRACIENTCKSLQVLAQGELISALRENFGDLPFHKAFMSLSSNVSSVNILSRITCGLSSATSFSKEEYFKFYEILKALPMNTANITQITHSLGRLSCATYNEREAKEIFFRALERFPNSKGFYHEAYLPIVLSHDVDLAVKWLDLVNKHPEPNLSPLRTRGILSMLGRYSEADHIWNDVDMPNINAPIAKYFYPDKLVTTFAEAKQKGAKKMVVYKSWGPADELAHACWYPAIKNVLESQYSIEVSFICDQRLSSIFQRCFPDIKFIPTSAKRYITSIKDFQPFSRLPGSDLCDHFDNISYEEAMNSDALILYYSAVYEMEEALKIPRFDIYYNSWLKPDLNLSLSWKQKLNGFSDKLLVGLSWRSSLSNGLFRNRGALTIADLESLFEIKDVLFVNLQYDDNKKENDFIERNFPGKMLTFNDLDQYNDFEGLSALNSCLDLVIGPGTTATAFPRALGCPTVLINPMFSTWRKNIDDKTSSPWSDNSFVLTPDRLGDINSLVQKIKQYIIEFKDSTQWRDRRALREKQDQ